MCYLTHRVSESKVVSIPVHAPEEVTFNGLCGLGVEIVRSGLHASIVLAAPFWLGGGKSHEVECIGVHAAIDGEQTGIILDPHPVSTTDADTHTGHIKTGADTQRISRVRPTASVASESKLRATVSMQPRSTQGPATMAWESKLDAAESMHPL